MALLKSSLRRARLLSQINRTNRWRYGTDTNPIKNEKVSRAAYPYYPTTKTVRLYRAGFENTESKGLHGGAMNNPGSNERRAEEDFPVSAAGPISPNRWRSRKPSSGTQTATTGIGTILQCLPKRRKPILRLEASLRLRPDSFLAQKHREILRLEPRRDLVGPRLWVKMIFRRCSLEVISNIFHFVILLSSKMWRQANVCLLLAPDRKSTKLVKTTLGNNGNAIKFYIVRLIKNEI
ncbi:hypothetical protein KM043_016757 [Ampulex compressa]|nr:hypothetical protein KM043_016757 [Ampulex compressa]